MNKKSGYIAILTTAVILGTFGIWIRILSNTFSNPGQVLARSAFATIIISLIVLRKNINPFKIYKKNILYIVLFSLVFPLSLVAFTISANLTRVTNSLFMLYAGSLTATAILGRILFKEKFNSMHVISLILVFLGLCFFIYPFDFASLNSGLFFGLVSGLLEGSSHTLRRLMQNVSKEVIVFFQSVSGSIISLVLLLVSHESFIREFHISSIFIAALFGLFLVSIGYLLAYGFANLDVNLGTIILSTELFFAIILNAIFLREFPTIPEFTGGFLILLGSIIVSLKFTTKKTTTA